MICSHRHKKRAIALVTALTIGAVLFVLASAFLVHLEEDFAAHRRRQWGVQAEWNARACYETYLHTRELPPPDPVTKERIFRYEDGSSTEVCLVHQEKQGLRFEGVSHGIHKSLLLLKDGRLIRSLP